ncbi:unnamed protein product [Clonostachys byssicola]|uniref:Heterokaryon incompatibility domain-containing protein n=1 Tax=Clonostachys byssicola TaxID=160290 RepID=A0A9N9Y3Q2_9HYPO|nr:unnamed protein product [Clonostachys byssicola]
MELNSPILVFAEASSICEICATITLTGMRGQGEIEGEDEYDVDSGFKHYPAYKQLSNSASQGCRLCIIIEHSLYYAFGGKLEFLEYCAKMDGQTQVRLVAYTTGALRPSSVKVLCGPDHTRYAWLELSAPNGSQTAQWIKGRVPEGDPLSPISLSRIKDWHRDCLKNHLECSMNLNPYLPTRVIDVGAADGTEEPRLLLSDEKSRGPYVAMSYCWGGVVPLRTTTNNIHDHTREIPLTSLPQTFKDAIVLTRSLGCRYLWIDALCIVQDDPLDWEREAADMGRIYRDSALTLSATSAKTSEDGFLGPYKSDLILRCSTKYTEGQETHEMVFSWPFSPLSSFNYVDATGDRGWTLQELVLSPRVLHFVQTPARIGHQMIWECNHHSVQEDGVRLVTNFHIDLSRPKSLLGRHHAANATIPLSMVITYTWLDLVEAYSCRKLTYESDKLVAFSGLAAEIKRLSGYRYAAGLWEEELRLQLLWVPRTPGSRTQGYIAPSWSWLSFDGAVDCSHIKRKEGGLKFRFTVRHLDTHVSVSGPSLFGTVESATAVLSGFMKPAVFDPRRKAADQCYLFYDNEDAASQDIDVDIQRTMYLLEEIKHTHNSETNDPFSPRRFLHKLTSDAKEVLDSVDLSDVTPLLCKTLTESVEAKISLLKRMRLSLQHLDNWKAANQERLCHLQAREPSLRLDKDDYTEDPQLDHESRPLASFLQSVRRFKRFQILFDTASDAIHRQDEDILQELDHQDDSEYEFDLRRPDPCSDQHRMLIEFKNSKAHDHDNCHMPVSVSTTERKGLMRRLDPDATPGFPEDFYPGTANIPGKIRFDTDKLPRHRRIWLMQVLASCPFLESGKCTPHGLALLPTGNVGEYERIGVFQLHPDHVGWFDDVSARECIYIV